MRIDISAVEGNTVAALGIAVQFLQRTGAAQSYTDEMRKAVLKANSAAEARKHIENFTGGAVTFYDSTKGD